MTTQCSSSPIDLFHLRCQDATRSVLIMTNPSFDTIDPAVCVYSCVSQFPSSSGYRKWRGQRFRVGGGRGNE